MPVSDSTGFSPRAGCGVGFRQLWTCGLTDPKIKARIADLGGTADFGRLIADEAEKWGTAVKLVGIKAD